MAKLLGVTSNTVCTWELNQHEINPRYYSKVIQLLGGDPLLQEPKTLGQQFKRWRLESGFSIKKASKVLHIDGPTLYRVEMDDFKVRTKTWQKVKNLFL